MRIKYHIITAVLLFLTYTNVFSQNFVPFSTRFDQDLRGDHLIIGNNILNRDSNTRNPNDPYNATTGDNDNGSLDMQYIDIDGDASTFNSSSANLDIPDGSGNSCYKIAYAGLYWGALLQSGSRTNINRVKLKLPTGSYLNITGNLIYDADATPIGGGKPYACFADVTALIQGLANPEGTYTIADVVSSTGSNGGLGLSAGWSLYIVYEDPTLSAKSIVSFDGFSGINGSTNLTIPVSGFRTIPAGPVRASFAFTAMEGDERFTGDFLEINGNPISTAERPVDNFFNSTITTTAGYFTNRVPNSLNTLGYDAGVININNAANGTIGNNVTSATIDLGTGGDVYYYFFNAFAVEIIEPNIVLTKVVKNIAGVEIGNTDVALCQDLIYEIGFQNIGNDNTQNLTIRDVLPINVTFNPATLILPAGVTYVYTAATRTIVFTIPNNLVNINDQRSIITIPVKVVCTCDQLDDACSNVVTNQAFASYQGVVNTTQITDDPSLAGFSACNISPPSPTNFLVGLDDCNFTTDVVMCGNNPVTLTAANGYTSYVWAGPGTITPVAGTNNQSVIVTTPGTYTVNDIISLTPCKSIIQTFNVVDYGSGTLTNPVIPYADQVVICPDDFHELPLIFLCGLADSQLIQTNISGATSIVWEQLNTASCVALANTNCANEYNSACTWTNVGTGANYTAASAGQFRVTINFPSGCSRTFYFNVFQNLLNPIAVPRDAVCTTPGQITITGVPAGYEYQLNCTGPWVSGNIFTGLSAGIYSVCIRQTGVTGGCVFTLPNIPIRNRVFTVSAILTQPLCSGDKGTINLAANDVLPQYTFTINQMPGSILVSSVGPTNSSSTVFNNLNPGNYTYTVTTQDGCTVTTPFTINQPPVLTATIALTRPLTPCGPGEITVYPVGGTPPYNYIVTGAVTVTQGSPVIAAPVAGTYNVQVVDFNNCSVTVSLPVTLIPPPVYAPSQTNVFCYGSNTGAINFNLSNANGFTLEYSIDGVNFFPTPNFPNLVAGTYTIIVRYTLGTAVCLTTAVTIIITQPAAALTASAGVSELAGCGPLGEGKVRIINPQGGVPAYTYSFNNGVTYTGVNEAYLLPGTYTVYIKDANGCIFAMTVTLDPAPTAPTIAVTPPVFACNGTSTSTITVNNNGGSFAYTYSLDTVLNTPPTNNVFTNVACGSHTVTVNYQATNIPTPSNLLFEDFGIGGDTTSPGINPAYCFEQQINNAALWCKSGPQINDGDYSVTKRILFPFGAWFPFLDHTTNGANPNARFLAINIGGAAGVGGILYTKPIASIIPNQNIKVSLWAANLLKIDPSNTQSPPDLTIQLVKDFGLPTQSVIASSNTGNIPKSNVWLNYNLNLNPGPNTNLSFVIRSNIAVTSGNDVVIDDINVYQEPIACITTKNFPINIACNQAFTAQVTGSNNVSCNGGNNGTITISAQNFGAAGFQYSTNGGATWITSLVSPVTISGLTAATYNIQIRYDSNPANTACSFPFTTIITQPNLLVPSASVTTPATCLTGATITASAVGGTPAYQYQLQTSPGAVIVAAYQASGTFTNVATGDYVVLVRDANLCLNTSIPVSVFPATAPTATISAASNFCYSSPAGATIVVTALGGVAPYTYNINGGAFQVSNTFPNLTPGSYTIIVRDAYGCTVPLPVQTIAPQLTLSTVLTKDLDCTASPNAVITGTMVGGYSPYTYQVSFNTGAFTNLGAATSPFTYSTAVAGTYQFQVTDSRGCIAQSGVITINPIVNPTVTTAVTNVTCNGLSNGSVTITPSLGIAPYVIQWNGTGPFTSTTTYSGLAEGTYTYIVRDSKSCPFNGSVTIGQPATITGIATLTTQYTCTTSGVITVSGVTGGTSPYTYSISGLAGPFQAGTTFTITAAGTYIVTIKDLSGCTFATAPIIVTPNTPPTDLTFVATALTCPTNVSTVTLTATGGSPLLNYQIIAPVASATAYNISNVFSNLAPGTYTFQVRDSRNCTYQESYTIAPLPVLTVTGSVVNNVRCFGTATGSATFTVGGSTGFTYTINTVSQGVGTSPITLTNQLAGTYTIVVTNTATNCNATTSVTIAQPAAALAATLTPSPVTCLINGQVVVNAVGGWGGNVYTIFPPAGTLSGNTFSNLPAGTYTITTTDSGGCAVTNTFTLNPPTAPTATISAASNFCYSSPAGATIVVTALGGVAPYAYNINGGAFQASNTFPNLTPGSYTIIVRDAYGCTVPLPVQTIAPQLTLSTVLTKDLDCTPAPGTPNAVITATSITGGYPAYTYQVIFNTVLNPTVFAIPSVPFTYSTSVPGTYQILITDSRGCTALSPVYTVHALTPLVPTDTQTNNLCFGDAAGTVTITPAGGVAPYEIQWNGLGAFTSQTIYTGLVVGTYTYIVRDANFCTKSESVTITQPAQIAYTPIVNPITCNPLGGYTLGSICVNTLIGGIAPYTYTLVDLTGGTATQTHIEPLGANYCFPSIDFGLYDLSVTDANGCTIVKSNLVMSNPPNDLTFVVNPLGGTCASGSSVTVTLVGALGVGPFEFGIYNSTIIPYVVFPNLFVPASSPPFTHLFTGLTPGAIFTIVVRDTTTGCYYFEQMTAPTATSSTINVTPLVVNPVPCRGGNNGSVTFSLSGINAGTTSISYSVHYASNNLPVGAATTGTLTAPFTMFPFTTGPLAPGTYNIQFTEIGGPISGCGITSANFTIIQSATDLTLSATTTNDNCNVNAGQIAPIASGGTGPYLYQYLPWSPLAPPPPTATLPGLWGATNPFNGESGTYDVYVRDAFGCIKMVTVTIGLDPTPSITANLVNACVAQGTYQINVTMPTAGIAPYTFSVDGGAFVANTTPFNISGLSSGVHTVEVKDKNGCGNTVSVTILTPLIVSAVFTTQPTCFNNNGTITASASGGSAPANYTYTLLTSGSVVIVGPQGSNVFVGQPAGCYIIRVTDSTTGCSANTPFCLTLPTPVTFTAVPTSVTCNGGTDGTITINLTGASDNPPYTYQILPGAPQASNIFTGLAAGTYTVQVNSGRGCTLIDNNVIVGTPTPVVASASATPFACVQPANTVNVSTIDIDGIGGTPAYTYSIDGINYFPTDTFNIIDNGAIQNITVYVKDSKGCIDTDIVTINPLPTITNVTILGLPKITCTNPELVTLTITGGSGNFTYQVLPSGAANVTQVGTTNQFNISAPGTYNFQVTDTTTLCTFAVVPYVVAPFNNLDVIATPTTPVTCFGNNDGAISINVSGYTGAYSYTVLGSLPLVSGVGNTAVNPLVISGLLAGSYTVQVTETASPFCVKISNVVTVASPSQVALSLVSNVNANCNLGAQVTVIGSGGTPAYTYAFVQNGFIPVLADYTASNTAVLNPATNTQWDVYVKDANGCFTFIDVTIATDVLPTVALPTFASDQCTSTGTSYTFTATGTGLAPLTYSIGAGFQSSGTFTVSAPGVYTVTIKDKNGCTASAPITIYAPIGVSAGFTTQPTCANPDGTITVTASGGSGTYEYTLLTPALVVIQGPQASNTFIGFAAVLPGYIVRVRDLTTNCIVEIPFIPTPAIPVTFDPATITDVSCNGGNDGTITVNLGAGNNDPIYTYQIIMPFIGSIQNSNIFTGLIAQNYTIQVVSGRNCPATQSVTVGTPNPIVVPATTITQFGCAAGTNAVNLATITVTGVTGGSGVYTNYEFILGGVIQQSGPSNTYATANTALGTYTINVYDNKGCLGTTLAVINPYISISNPRVTSVPITCATNEEITILVDVAGGLPPVFSYTVTGYPTNAIPYNVTQNSPTFTGLTIGDYLITVLNPVTGCSVQTIHYVNNPNTFSLLINNIVDVTCFLDNNGSAEITIVDNNLIPSNDAGPFNYTILNSLGLTVASGTSVNAGPVPITGLLSGIYTANVTLVNPPQCTVSQNFTISGPTSGLTVSTTNTPITCVAGNNDGTITASATGGWGAPYEFQLQMGAGIITAYNANPNFTGLTAGTYTVYVRDVRGCELPSTNVTLTNPSRIDADVSAATPNLACFGDTTSITISNIVGGQGGNYSYTIKGPLPSTIQSGAFPMPASGTVTIPGLAVGNYEIEIRDGWSCFNTFPVAITQPNQLASTLITKTAISCTQDTVLTLTGIDGTPPYSYSTTLGGVYTPFMFPTTTDINIPVGITGVFSYYVQDANGCKTNTPSSVTVTPLDILTLTLLSKVDVNCYGESTGAINVVALGGLGNYQYTILNTTTSVVTGPQASGNFANLPFGNYQVSVVSGDCTVPPLSVRLDQPTAPFDVSLFSISGVTCSDKLDGEIILKITGYVGPLTYVITTSTVTPPVPPIYNSQTIGLPVTQTPPVTDPVTPFDPSVWYATISNLAPNVVSSPPGVTPVEYFSYFILLQNGSSGCSDELQGLIIEKPEQLLADIVPTATVDVACFGETNGSFTVAGVVGGVPNANTSISGGTVPYLVTSNYVYHYEDTDFNPLTPPVFIDDSVYTNLNNGVGGLVPNTHVFSGLAAGIYHGAIKDKNGCLVEFTQIIEEGPNFIPYRDENYDCVGNAPANEVVIHANSSNPTNQTATYSLNDLSSVAGPGPYTTVPAATMTYNNLAAGPYEVLVKINNCVHKVNFSINVVRPLTLSIAQTVGALNEITATATYGIPAYNFTFNGYDNGSDNTYVYDHTGDYEVTVTDSSGCFVTLTKPFTFIPIDIINVYTPGDGDGWGPTNTSNYPNLVTKVYDRYGRLVAELPEGQKWYGKYNGQELPSGDYWYVIKVDGGNDSEYVGHFTLYR